MAAADRRDLIGAGQLGCLIDAVVVDHAAVFLFDGKQFFIADGNGVGVAAQADSKKNIGKRNAFCSLENITEFLISEFNREQGKARCFRLDCLTLFLERQFFRV